MLLLCVHTSDNIHLEIFVGMIPYHININIVCMRFHIFVAAMPLTIYENIFTMKISKFMV